MTRVSLFNSPLLLGFEHVERMLDRAAKAANDGYPPYNIEQRSPNGLRITLAVAGFARDHLSVTVEDNQLIIRGRQPEDDERVYLHRDIAARQFQKSFVLAEGIDIMGAAIDNGLLHIDLARPQPTTTVRTVRIDDAPPSSPRDAVTVTGRPDADLRTAMLHDARSQDA